MMMYTGTSTEQDTRFSDKEKKLMKQMKFGDCLTQQVDMSKVKLDVLKPWITQKITEILKMEDDVVIDYVNNQLEEKMQEVEERIKKASLRERAATLSSQHRASRRWRVAAGLDVVLPRLH